MSDITRDKEVHVIEEGRASPSKAAWLISLCHISSFK